MIEPALMHDGRIHQTSLSYGRFYPKQRKPGLLRYGDPSQSATGLTNKGSLLTTFRNATKPRPEQRSLAFAFNKVQLFRIIIASGHWKGSRQRIDGSD